MNLWLANALNITCGEIGNCNTNSPTIDVALKNITSLIIGLVGSLAIIFIIYAGIQFAISGGNAKQVQTAKQTLTYSVIGLVLAICAYAIVSFIAGSF